MVTHTVLSYAAIHFYANDDAQDRENYAGKGNHQKDLLRQKFLIFGTTDVIVACIVACRNVFHNRVRLVDEICGA